MINFRKRPDNEFKNSLIELIPRLRRFALSLTSNQSDADDLVQAACERALKKWHQWKPGTRLDSWMFKIIYNLMIDERRKRNQYKSISIEDENLISSSVDQARQTEARLQLQKVKEAMKKLSEDERALISLVCLEGLPYKEAARILNIPIGTVMSRLSRARKKLYRIVYGK